MSCKHCGNANRESFRRMAGIAHSFMGDTCTHSYYLCTSCGHWTVLGVHENFGTGSDQGFQWGPYSQEVGERCVELIRACPAAMDEDCDCPAHETLRHGPPQDWRH